MRAIGHDAAELLCAPQNAAAPGCGRRIGRRVGAAGAAAPTALRHPQAPPPAQARTEAGWRADGARPDVRGTEETRAPAGADPGALPAYDAVLPQPAGVSQRDQRQGVEGA